MLTEALEDKLSNEYTNEEKEVLKQVANIIFKRVAKLLVSEISAILRYIDENLEEIINFMEVNLCLIKISNHR